MLNFISPINNLISFYKDPILLLDSFSQSKVNSFRMAHLRFHHIVGLEEIKSVLIHQQKKIVKTPQAQYFTSLALGEGLVSTDGEEWLSKRKEANHVFSFQDSDQLVNMMIMELEKNSTWGATGTKISLNNLMLNITLKVICKLVFGYSDDASLIAINESMKALIVETYEKIIAPVNLPLFIPTSSNKKFNYYRKAYDNVIKEMTNKSFNENRSEALAFKYLQKGNSVILEDINITAIALKTIIAAGHETTATSLTWLLYELSKNPEIENSVKEEFDKLDLDNIKNTSHVLKGTTYTQCVINETLRMYPPIWLMGRVATENLNIGSKRIKKNDNILISPYHIHRSKKYWKEPNKFMPERFFNKDLSFTESAFFPFGLGPRQCIGSHLAILEMLLILAAMYKKFDVKVYYNDKIDKHPYITLRPSRNIFIDLKSKN